MKIIQAFVFTVCMFFVGACSGSPYDLKANKPQPPVGDVEVNWIGDEAGIVYAYVVGSVSRESLLKDAQAHCRQYNLLAFYWKDKETDYTFVNETLFKCERPENVKAGFQGNQ